MILISQLEGYLNGTVSLKVMRDFSWNMIEYFSKCKKTDLPVPQDFEKELWYAIWEIQHLADEAHEEEITGVKIFRLLGGIPSSFIRPIKSACKSFFLNFRDLSSFLS